MVEQINEYAGGDSINNTFKKNDADCGPLIYFFPFNSFFKNGNSNADLTKKQKSKKIKIKR